MLKERLVAAIIFSLILPLSTLAADTYTLTTYYPAPTGKYNTLSAVNATFTNATIATATITNPLTLNSLQVTNSATVGTFLTVGTTLGVTGAATLGSTLSAAGEARLNGGISVDNTNFTVSGTTGDITTAGALDVNGNTSLGDAATDLVDVTGGVNITNGNITMTKNNGTNALMSLSSNGNAYNMSVNGGADQFSIAKAGGIANLTMTGTTVGVAGDTITVNPVVLLNVTGNADFGNWGAGTGDVSIGNSLDVKNALFIGGTAPNIAVELRSSRDQGNNFDVLNVWNAGLEASAVFSRSDERLKENIIPITDAVAKVKALNGVSYQLKGKPVTQIGLIAQNVEKTVPEVVRTGSDGMKSVEYGHLVGLLIEAIKEQQAEIDSLKKALADVKGQ